MHKTFRTLKAIRSDDKKIITSSHMIFAIPDAFES